MISSLAVEGFNSKTKKVRPLLKEPEVRLLLRR
jgi:hypothetical protein